MEEVIPLPPQTINLFIKEGKDIISGWEVMPPGSDFSLRVLLDSAFPFSHIKIAYVGECRHLKWPHVEENGFLCLPVLGWRPIENLGFSIQERIELALQLLEDCQSEGYVKYESSKEFLSYWGRSASEGTFSIIDLSHQETRRVWAVQSDKHWLVGEDRKMINEWLKKQNKEETSNYFQAIFSCIETAPSLPLPKNTRQFRRWMLDQCHDIDMVLSQLSPFEQTVVLLSVQSPGGMSLIGAIISPMPQNGFRKQSRNSREKYLSARRLKAVWDFSSRLRLTSVKRADGAWVHGRGLDPYHQSLASSHLVIFGVGSLGSQVAARLAQAGVGHITLIDPEVLATSNVGRHALGMDSARKSKAEQLANMLSAKYPHGSFQGIESSFQAALQDSLELIKDADLIVSCVAETDQDLSWDSWHRSSKIVAPTVYGWLGTQGATGHALALTADGPGLSCFFDSDGFLRNPDADFRGDTKMKVEPGCGTEFQPYGPLAAGQVELLVTRLCLDLLTRKTLSPQHRVYSCSTDDLKELGGRWTMNHSKHRPDGYDGPLEYRSPVTHCGVCYRCQAR